MSETSHIGKSRPLVEGGAKVRGAVRFATDAERRNLLHAQLVTSPFACAGVGSIDTEAARACEGVVAVLTAADLPRLDPSSRGRLLLAQDQVRFQGHPVALVVAETPAAAADAAEQVLVDYEPRDAVLDLETAMAPGAPLVWPGGLPGASAEAAAHGAAGGGGEEASEPSNVTGPVHFERGDVDGAMAAATVVVERTFTTHGVHQSYLEPHAVLAEPSPESGGMRVETSTQASFYVRQEIARALELPESDVTVVPTAVGGGFGGKFLLHDVLVALVARRLGQAVRLVLGRGEELVAGNPAPATRMRLRLGADREGKLQALELDFTMDVGCFPSSMAGLAGVLAGSPYPVESLRIDAREVLTNKASVGAYRAPCAPQVAFALESALDELAAELGMDPLELRLRNAAKPGDPMVHGAPWPSMGMREVLEALQSHPAWQDRAAARAEGRGVGIAVAGWPGGTEPAAASCSLQRDGTIHIHVGSVDLTGTNTTLATIAAEAYGVDPDKVRIIGGDTDQTPFAGATGGSKITYTVGSAVLLAAKDARQQTLELAAESLEVAVEDLEIVDGEVRVKGAPDKALPLGKIAARTMRFRGSQAPVFGHGRHANNTQSPAFCAQLVEVSVDPDTGAVTVHRLVVVQDAGRAINPDAVRGQMMGGATQGLGWALDEALIHRDGQLATGSLMDYALPRFHRVPELETVIVEVPSPIGPFGARGVGEPPVIPTAGAVANAIADACGARLVELPMTAPAVLAALNSQSRRS